MADETTTPNQDNIQTPVQAEEVKTEETVTTPETVAEPIKEETAPEAVAETPAEEIVEVKDFSFLKPGITVKVHQTIQEAGKKEGEMKETPKWNEKDHDVFWKEFRQVYAKDGVNFLRCQHLTEAPKDHPVANIIWIGENRRLLVCGVCWKMSLGTAFYNIVHPGTNFPDEVAKDYGETVYSMAYLLRMKYIQRKTAGIIAGLPWRKRIPKLLQFWWLKIRTHFIPV